MTECEEKTLKERAMEHLLASCDRRDCLVLIEKAYNRITMFDGKTEALHHEESK